MARGERNEEVSQEQHDITQNHWSGTEQGTHHGTSGSSRQLLLKMSCGHDPISTLSTRTLSHFSQFLVIRPG